MLTLPVSTATTEQVFSAMRIVKTKLRSEMEDEFLANSLITYIQKDITKLFDDESIIDAFDLKKERRAQFRMHSFSRSCYFHIKIKWVAH